MRRQRDWRWFAHAAMVVLMAIAATTGCRPPHYDDGGGSSASYSSGSSGSSGSSSSSSSYSPPSQPSQPSQPSWLQRSASQSGRAELAVSNEYTLPQYVFVDGTYLGTVAVGGQATFQISAGTHTFAFSDSMSPTDNAQTATSQVAYGERLTARIFVQHD
ncbi:MAG: hypothetical protein AB7K09_07830 [Planctomycetota bacterium]